MEYELKNSTSRVSGFLAAVAQRQSEKEAVQQSAEVLPAQAENIPPGVQAAPIHSGAEHSVLPACGSRALAAEKKLAELAAAVRAEAPTVQAEKEELALLREKLVAQSSGAMVVVADDRKMVDVLGAFPLPIEITPFALGTTARPSRTCWDAKPPCAWTATDPSLRTTGTTSSTPTPDRR